MRLARIISLPLLALMLFTTLNAAAAGELIPRRVLFGNPERGAPYISPDGKYLAYTAAHEGVLNVWVAPTGDITNAKAVTSEKRRPVMEFHWAQSGTHILYFQDQNGDENFHLYAVDVRTKETRDLTPHKSVRARIIAKSHSRPNEILIGLNNRKKEWHDIWLLNILTGQSKLVQKNDGFADFMADESLTVQMASKPISDGGMQYFTKSKSAWKKFIRVKGDDAFNTEPLFFSAGSRHVYFTDSRNRDKSALTSIDTRSGKTALITESNLSDIAHVMKDPLTFKPLAAAFEYDRMEWRAIDPSLQADLTALNRHIAGHWFPLSQSRDNRLWTVWIDTPGKPVRFGLYNRSDKTLKPLYTARPNLEGAPLPASSAHIIKARDGLPLVSFLTLPKSTPLKANRMPQEALPMVLMVHGGPWSRDRISYNPYSAWLANRGYAVLAVNFRGSTGFGKSFTNAGDREWGGKMHTDLIDAVDWAVREGVAEPEKIAIYGASYGGYAALTGLTSTPDKFACAVDIVGPSSLLTMLANVPSYWRSFLDTFKRRVGDPSTPSGRKFLAQRSPLFHANRIKRPLLIGQGANDPRVTQKEAEQIVQAMQKNNLPVTYVLYSDEGHGFARAQNRLSFNAITEAFLAQCLDGDAEPIGKDFEGSSVSVPVGKEHIEGLADALDQP